MTREHHVASVAPDWSIKSQRFSPLTHTDPQRRRPMAVRRLHPQQIENLRVRWFAIGSLSTLAPMAIVYGAVRLLGGA